MVSTMVVMGSVVVGLLFVLGFVALLVVAGSLFVPASVVSPVVAMPSAAFVSGVTLSLTVVSDVVASGFFDEPLCLVKSLIVVG